MASERTNGAATAAAGGRVLFAYDGSELAEYAIEQAGGQLAPGRDAVVVCVWQPADVGFLPVGEREFDAAQASEVRKAAEETAALAGHLLGSVASAVVARSAISVLVVHRRT